MELLDTFYQEMEAHEDIIGIVRSYEDISRNWEQGRMSALLTVEEGGTCQGKTAFLRDFYRLGVRMMTLTWNFPNELAFPQCQDCRGGRHLQDGAGYRAWTYGYRDCICGGDGAPGNDHDISHLNDAGIWDVFRHTKKPFVASHSNARAVASHPRNMTDDMIRELADRGGVMGINYYTCFLRDFCQDEAPVSRVSYMVEHMKHIRNVGGIGCLGLGSDFDGIECELEMKDASMVPMLADAMKREGFSQSEIEAVFYKNVLRVYREIL